MYEITPIQPRRSRLGLMVFGAVALVFVSLCMLATAGALLFSAANLARPQRTERAALRPLVQVTPRAQVIVEPPPNGIDYESAVLRTLYEQVNPAIVNIAVLTAHPEVDGLVLPTPGSEDGQGFFQFGSGSGFIWDTDGHIVTNFHVVESAEQVQVTFSDGTMSMAEVVGVDEDSDLAVIRIDPAGYNLTPVRLGNLEDIYVGMRVAAIGNPFGLRGTLTSGIVSAIGRSIPSRGQFSIPDSIQTDAAINPGNSGGPLLNERGEVIGVNAQIRSETRANSGVGFALPVSIVARVVPSLIENGDYEHSYMGISGATFSPICGEEQKLDVNLRGVLVEQVLRNGPSARAGLRGGQERVTSRYPNICPSRRGADLITAIDGQPVVTFDDILIYLERYTSPGDVITFSILRDGESKQVEITLAARPR